MTKPSTVVIANETATETATETVTAKRGTWQKLFCAVDDDDDGFRLLADLSLCTFFGCGDPEVEREIPRVVSISSEDDCRDSISDICEIRHCSVKIKKKTSMKSTSSQTSDPPSPTRCSKSQASTAASTKSSSRHRPDPPSQRRISDPQILLSISNPPPPPLLPLLPDNVSFPTQVLDELDHRGIQQQSQQQQQEPQQNDESAMLPHMVIVKDKKKKRSKSTSRTRTRTRTPTCPPVDIPPVIYGKAKKSKGRQDPPHEYPMIIYSKNKSSSKRCAYV